MYRWLISVEALFDQDFRMEGSPNGEHVCTGYWYQWGNTVLRKLAALEEIPPLRDLYYTAFRKDHFGRNDAEKGDDAENYLYGHHLIF